MDRKTRWWCHPIGFVAKKLVYPNSIKNTELFNKLADPQEDWEEYDLVRMIVTGDFDTCEHYNFASSSDEFGRSTTKPMYKSPLASPQVDKPIAPAKMLSLYREVFNSKQDIEVLHL